MGSWSVVEVVEGFRTIFSVFLLVLNLFPMLRLATFREVLTSGPYSRGSLYLSQGQPWTLWNKHQGFNSSKLISSLGMITGQLKRLVNNQQEFILVPFWASYFLSYLTKQFWQSPHPALSNHRTIFWANKNFVLPYFCK